MLKSFILDQSWIKPAYCFDRLVYTECLALIEWSRTWKRSSCVGRPFPCSARWKISMPSLVYSRTSWGTSKNLCWPSASTEPSWMLLVSVCLNVHHSSKVWGWLDILANAEFTVFDQSYSNIVEKYYYLNELFYFNVSLQCHMILQKSF